LSFGIAVIAQKLLGKPHLACCLLARGTPDVTKEDNDNQGYCFNIVGSFIRATTSVSSKQLNMCPTNQKHGHDARKPQSTFHSTDHQIPIVATANPTSGKPNAHHQGTMEPHSIFPRRPSYFADSATSKNQNQNAIAQRNAAIERARIRTRSYEIRVRDGEVPG